MNLEDKLFTLLSSHSNLTNLVSNRISPEITESKTAKPFIVYTRTKSEFWKYKTKRILLESSVDDKESLKKELINE